MSSYTVYADGWIEQYVKITPTTNSTVPAWVSLPIPYTDINYRVISVGQDVSTSADEYEYCAGIATITMAGHPDSKEKDGFKIRLAGANLVGYRENYTFGY